MRFAPRNMGRLIVGGWTLVMLLAGARLVTGFRIDNSVGVWFAADDEALVTYRQYLSDFGHSESMLVVLQQQGTPDVRAAERAGLAARIAGLPDVRGVLSADDLPPAHPVSAAFLRPDPAGSDEALLVTIANDLDRQDRYREALLADVRAAAAAFPTVRSARIAGTAVINAELNRSARRDMWVFFPAAVLLLAVVGGMLFRNVRDTAVMLFVALGTVVMTAGLLVGVGYPLNMVTIMLPTVLIALSVADAVHLIHEFHRARGAQLPAGAAAIRAARHVALPCLGTTLTTIAGFLAFGGSAVLPVFQLAVFGAVGVGLAWVVTMTGGAALLALLWSSAVRQPRAVAGRGGAWLESWHAWIARRPALVAAGCAVSAVLLVGLADLEADTDYVAFFRSDAAVSRDYRAIAQAGFPQNPLTLVVKVPAGRPLASAWGALDSLVRRIADLPEVHAVLSPTAFASGPADLAAAARRFGFLSADGHQVQLTVMTDYPSSRELLGTIGRIQVLAGLTLPYDMALTPTGTTLLWAHMDEGVIQTQRQSLAVVTIVCLIVLATLFRSLPLGIVGLLASLYPVGVVLGLMGWWGIPLNMATVLIAGIAVGLAVDDTIHLVHAYQARRRDGHDRRTASGRAMRDVGGRMVMTSAMLVGTFAGMGLSGFMPTAQFGILSSLTIVLALLADLTILPLILAWGTRTASAPAVERWV